MINSGQSTLIIVPLTEKNFVYWLKKKLRVNQLTKVKITSAC